MGDILPHILAALLVGYGLHVVDMDLSRGRPADPRLCLIPPLACAALFLLANALLGRPLAALAVALGAAALLFTINRVKTALFREPLTFMDNALAAQIIRHPVFYLPYLLPWPIRIAIAAGVLLLGTIWLMDGRLLPHVRWMSLAAGAVLVSPALAFLRPNAVERLLARHYLAAFPLALDPSIDLKTYGLLPSMFLSFLHHRHRSPALADSAMGDDPGAIPPACVWGPMARRVLPHDTRPDVVLIQAESYFDLRRLDPALGAELYPNHDRLAEKGVSGRFLVDAHGAYTMRTEFSVLTGVAMDSLGTDRLNPYRMAARRPCWSLARLFSAQGYETICIHPFSAWFFRRDLVMPNLGFDRLLGDESFRDSPKIGPHVSDAALGECIISHLRGPDGVESGSRPRFIFAITMEAHGPWSRKSAHIFPRKDTPTLPDWADHDLDIYARHLANTDRMLGTIASAMESGNRPQGILCLYGDHVGSIPLAFKHTSFSESATNYVLWRTPNTASTQRRDLKAEELGGELLKATTA